MSPFLARELFLEEEPTARVNPICDVRRHLWICETQGDFIASTDPLPQTQRGYRRGACLDCGGALSIPMRRR